MSLKCELAKLRFDGVKSGLQRIRVAFLVTNVAASAMFIAAFNAYLSRSLDFLTSAELSGSNFVAQVQRESVSQILQSQTVTVALLGIRVRVEDFAFLGSLGMLICALWLYFGLRGYHETVLELLEDTADDTDADFRRFVAHGIDSFMVFSTLRPRRARIFGWLAPKLWYIPAIMIGLILCADTYAAWWMPDLAGTAQHMLKTVAESSPVKFLLQEIATVVFGVPALLLCRNVAKYDADVNHRLRKYFQQIPITPAAPEAGAEMPVE